MNIYYVRQFWFDDFVEKDGVTKRAYITWDDIGGANIKVSCQLNVVAPGAHIVSSDGRITGDLGTAAVGIKWYEYDDDRGRHRVDNTYFVPHATIRRCHAIQLTLAYRRVWTGAMGALYYFTD